MIGSAVSTEAGTKRDHCGHQEHGTACAKAQEGNAGFAQSGFQAEGQGDVGCVIAEPQQKAEAQYCEDQGCESG